MQSALQVPTLSSTFYCSRSLLIDTLITMFYLGHKSTYIIVYLLCNFNNLFLKSLKFFPKLYIFLNKNCNKKGFYNKHTFCYMYR